MSQLPGANGKDGEELGYDSHKTHSVRYQLRRLLCGAVHLILELPVTRLLEELFALQSGPICPVRSSLCHCCRSRQLSVWELMPEETLVYWPHWPRASGPKVWQLRHKTPDLAPHPTLRRWKLGLKTMVSPASETQVTIAIQSAELSSLASTGIKPVGGRKCGCWHCLVVVKPGFHRREAGSGTNYSRQTKRTTQESQAPTPSRESPQDACFRLFRRTGQIAPIRDIRGHKTAIGKAAGSAMRRTNLPRPAQVQAVRRAAQ